MADAWTARAVRLPGGTEPEELAAPAAAGAAGGLLPGRFALPGGLVDLHLHLALDVAGLGLEHDRAALVERNREAATRAGLLAARDLGAPPAGPDLLDLPRERFQPASRLLGPEGRSYPLICEHVDADALVARGVELARAGAAWVKVMWDFPGPDGNWLAAPANYPAETLRALVDAVHAEGARVAVHSTGPHVGTAVTCGVDSLEHGPSLDEATLAEMGRRGTGWVPTLWTAHRHLDPLAALGPGPAALAERVFANAERLLALAPGLGVPVLAGSDELPAGELWREVEALVRHGLDGRAAIAAASIGARTFLGLPAPAGDLVTYDDDPRLDPAALARPAAVVLAGERVA